MGTCASCGKECGFGDKCCRDCRKSFRRRFKRGDESPMFRPTITPNSLLNGLQTMRLDEDKTAEIGELYALHRPISATCYANAIATIISATKSLNYPSLLHDIVAKYGNKQVNVLKILRKECTKRGLKCRQININKAKETVIKNRMMVGSFNLNKEQWRKFSTYFKGHKKTAILTREMLKVTTTKTKTSIHHHAHAVCIIGFSESDNCWMIKNSFGDKWTEHRYFKIKLEAIPEMSFFDVSYNRGF